MSMFNIYITITIGVLLCFYFSSRSSDIRKLVRQSARWSTAAKQDESPMIAVLHANYGAGYLWALKDIATPVEISMAAGINIAKFEKEIIHVQDEATKSMIRACPSFGPDPTYLTSIGGEGM